MATIENTRISELQATSPRTLPVSLPSTYNTTGDHQGTWNSQGQAVHQNNQIQLSTTGTLLNAGGGALSSLDDVGGNYLGNWSGLSELVHRNSQITLSSSGSLNNAGGGTITSLPYSNTTGGPPTNADNTQNLLESASTSITVNSSNLFEIFGSGSAGVFIGDGGLFGRDTGGSTTFAINASNGAATFRGDITGGSDIDITGVGRFNGSTSGGGFTGAVVGNNSLNRDYGVIGLSNSAAGVIGSTSGSASGVVGQATGSGAGVVAINTAGGTALQISSGTFVTFSSALVSNLYASRASSADSVLGSNVSGTVASAANASNATNASNASSLGGVAASGWCRGVACDVGTAIASANGFGFISTVAGTETAATGGNNYRVRSTSDRRIKQNIEDATLGFDFLHALRPRKGQYKKTPGYDAHFLIAQEVEEVIEEFGLGNNLLATTDEYDGIKSVDYTSVSIIMLKNLCDAEKRIKLLESEIQLLKDKLQ